MILPVYNLLQEENRELRRALAIMWHAWNGDHKPPTDVLKLARKCYEQGLRANDQE